MSFADDIERFQQKVENRSEAVVRKIVMDCARSVVRLSPVDTGRFKGNWDYGFNVVPTSQFPTMDASGAVSLQRISSKLGKMSGNVHYIANNLPYAQRLEDGWSKQAPNGMVKLTVIKFQSIVDNAVRTS